MKEKDSAGSAWRKVGKRKGGQKKKTKTGSGTTAKGQLASVVASVTQAVTGAVVLPKLAVPEVPNLAVPEVPNLAVPEVSRLAVPEVSRLAVPEVSRLAVPEVPKLAVPEVSRLAVPEVPKLAVPEVPKLAVPEVPKLAVLNTVPEKPIVSATASEPKVISIAENRDYEVREMEATNVVKTQTTGRGRYSNTAAPTARVERLGKDASEKQRNIAAARRAGRDLQGGLELLDVDFLLGIVENIDAVDDTDITMRKLSLSEVMRSGRVHEVDSNALKAYVMDTDGLFGKEVQFECFKELAERSAANPKS